MLTLRLLGFRWMVERDGFIELEVGAFFRITALCGLEHQPTLGRGETQ